MTNKTSKKISRLLYGILFLISMSISVYAQIFVENEDFSDLTDGPYIFYSGDSLDVLCVDAGVIDNEKRSVVNNVQFPHLAFPISVRDHIEFDETHFNGATKIVALSDIHGQYHTMIHLLKTHQIINDEFEWTFGNGHLVINGDIADRGDMVTEAYWFLYELEKKALKAGGRVHVLLGNHELMIMHGDQRYIHRKYNYTTAFLTRQYKDLFNNNSVLGHWLRHKPVTIKIDDKIFVHGGFSKLILKHKIDLDSINSLFWKRIIPSTKEDIQQDEYLHQFYYEDSPLWYRGFADEENFSKKDSKKLLSKLKAKHVIVGHTSMDHIKSIYNNQIIFIDSSIKFGGKGEVLLWEDDKFFRGTIEGEKILLE